MTRRPLTWTLAAAGLMVVLAGWGLTLGKAPVSLEAVFQAFLGTSAPQDRFIILELRWPRIACAVLVGALLAWSGTLFQGVFRNPLVSPDFIGIEIGASAAAVGGIVLGVPSPFLAVLAFAGASGTALTIYALSWKGHLSGSRLILVGVGMNALLAALVSFLLVRANLHQAAQAYHWMVGSLYSTTQPEAGLLAAAALVLAPLGLLMIPTLKVLQIGDTGARSLGVPVEPARLAILLTACGLAASAVAVVGPVGFIALAMPHLARMLAGPLSAGVFLLAGFLGGVFLLAVDLAGQHALPFGLPAGLLAAAVGGPYFLFLLRRRDLIL